MQRMGAYVGRNGIWPNTVTCAEHLTQENVTALTREMSYMNTTAWWQQQAETELPCVFCPKPVKSSEN